MPSLPATTWWALLYSLVLEDTTEMVERREQLDEKLTALTMPARETWGRLPSQQRAMARAARFGRADDNEG